MMEKKILFFVIVILILSVSVVAQTSNEKTQYEKKVYEISLKYYAKISYNKEVKNLTKDELTWLNIDLKLYIIDCQSSNRINCLQNCLKFGDYSRIHGIEEGKKLWLNYKKEMKDALKLRTAQEKKNDLMDSEMGTVLRGIKKSFDSWAKKREFEKETERDRRVQQYSRQVFQDLCYEEMSKSISNYLSRLHFDFGEYDSEKEQFEIKTGSLILYLPFPIQRAKAFKDSMENIIDHCVVIPRSPSNFCSINNFFYPKTIELYELPVGKLTVEQGWDKGHYKGFDEIDHINNKINLNNDCLLYDSIGLDYTDYKGERVSKYCRYTIEEELIRIKYGNCPHYSLSFCQSIWSGYDREDIIINFDDLEIENPYLKGSSFNYTKEEFIPGPYLKAEVEKERQEQERIRKEEELKKQQEQQFNLANDTLQQAVNKYNSQLKKYPYDYHENVITYTLPKELQGDSSALYDTLHILLGIIVQKEQQLTERYRMDSVFFKNCSDTLQFKLDEVNQQLLSYPYNLQRTIINDSLPFFLFGSNKELSELLHEKIRILPSKKKQVEEGVCATLRQNDAQQFVAIFFSLSSNKQIAADSLYLECRCKYQDRLSFDLSYIDNKLSTCDCRQIKYQEVGSLYHSQEEFDISYNQLETEFKKELQDRKNEMSLVKELEILLQKENKQNLKKAQSTNKEDLIWLLVKIKYHRERYYYSDVMELVFKYNEKLSKEWEKNGKYFLSKIEMYDSYIGEDYDKVLKEKKKNSDN